MTTAELEAIRHNFESEQTLDTADSRALLTEVDRLQGLLDRTQQDCTWTADEDYVWHTDCGNAFVFESDGPLENKLKFCGYCGKTLRAAIPPSEASPK